MRQLIRALTLATFVTACVPAPTVPVAGDATATLAAATPTQTALPTSTVMPTATAEEPTEIIPSPDGQYIAQIWNWGSFRGPMPPTIDILNKQHSVLWQIPYQGQRNETAMPCTCLEIYGWSKDSADLYFYYVFSPDGGVFAFHLTGERLQKIHIADGHIEPMLPVEGMTSFAFSPDGTQLAYIWDKDALSFLYIRDLLTGTEKRAPVVSSSAGDLMVGDIRWSTDGKHLAYQTQSSDFAVQTIYLDIARMKPKVVQEYRVEEMWFEGWTPDGRLRFFQPEKVIAIDPMSGETALIGTPTPIPTSPWRP